MLFIFYAVLHYYKYIYLLWHVWVTVTESEFIHPISHHSDISSDILSSCDSKELTQCCCFILQEHLVLKGRFLTPGLAFAHSLSWWFPISKSKMYMHVVCNHVCWKSPVPPMKVPAYFQAKSTNNKIPFSIFWDLPQSFISSCVLRSDSSFWKSNLSILYVQGGFTSGPPHLPSPTPSSGASSRLLFDPPHIPSYRSYLGHPQLPGPS